MDCLTKQEAGKVKAIILASGSPRRSEILTHMGVAFEKQAANVDEHCDLGAWEAVAELSRRKALAVAAHFPGRVVLAADTWESVDFSLGEGCTTDNFFSLYQSYFAE